MDQLQQLADDLLTELAQYDFDNNADIAYVRGCHVDAGDVLSRLQERFPPLYKLPLEGQLLWRRLDDAVRRLDDGRFNRVFILVDRLQDWLVRHFKLAPAAPPLEGLKPVWDADRRELRYNGQLCKRYRQPAPNQEAILATFQDDGWPPRIDNPIGTDPQQLADAVRGLNGRPHGIVFERDGTGEGVRWKPRRQDS